MSRVFAIGFAFIALAGCERAAEPAAPAETAAAAATAAPAEVAAAAAAAAPAAPAVEPIVALEARAATCLRLMDAAEAAGTISAETEAAMETASCDTLFTEGRALRDAYPALAPRLDAALEPLD